MKSVPSYAWLLLAFLVIVGWMYYRRKESFQHFACGSEAEKNLAINLVARLLQHPDGRDLFPRLKENGTHYGVPEVVGCRERALESYGPHEMNHMEHLHRATYYFHVPIVHPRHGQVAGFKGEMELDYGRDGKINMVRWNHHQVFDQVFRD